VKPSLGRIWASSAAFSAVFVIVSLFWQANSISLLGALFLSGFLAGCSAQRHGWLCGLIVGFPLAMVQMSRRALREHHSFLSLLADPDYWRLLIPSAIVGTGFCIMGAMVGVWMASVKWEPKG